MSNVPRKQCEICKNNKMYNITYFPSHKKSKLHKKRIEAIKIREEQLKEATILNCNDDITKEDLINDIIKKLNILKDKIIQ